MLIRLKNAVKKYGSGEALVYALDHAGLTLDEGEICVILGPSGSGKSTLLNMLGGLDTLDEGELTVEENIEVVADIFDQTLSWLIMPGSRRFLDLWAAF